MKSVSIQTPSEEEGNKEERPTSVRKSIQKSKAQIFFLKFRFFSVQSFEAEFQNLNVLDSKSESPISTLKRRISNSTNEDNTIPRKNSRSESPKKETKRISDDPKKRFKFSPETFKIKL